MGNSEIPGVTQENLRLTSLPYFPVTRETLDLFFLSGFCFTNIHESQDCKGRGGGHFINSSLPLPPALQILRHELGNYSRELTTAHSQQPDWYWEPLVSEPKSLTTKLCTQTLDSASVFIFFSYTRKKNRRTYLQVT